MAANFAKFHACIIKCTIQPNICAYLLHYKSDAAKLTVTQPDACLYSRGQVHGRRHGNGRVAQSERRRGAAPDVGPVLIVTMWIVII